ncbi:hypothetical protein BEP19_15745 [Ammoniphilus oxalaticus]|uniref:HTH cro/C1-type domain-containing protein n=1 Tax=Ammoniphilus oxalaticus TaxID=66863 RepID=A0A419SDG5_9BACL|nr:helix-turn-helix transcriptional regulator [Ammoniphilus oxalaticus]RKD21124.1 hypothetical protein BEP19_15745 [Ammoniphilus oxalaticus]
MGFNPNEFGKELRRLRRNKRLTMNQLGDKVDLTQPYISMIENGKAGKVIPDTIKKLSDGLGVDYSDLMRKAGYLKNRKENAGKGFGDYIKELREKAGKTIEEVSYESGLSTEEIQRIENKEVNEPSKNKLLRLGKSIGVDDLYMWFFENTSYHLYGGDVFDLMFNSPSKNKAKITATLPKYLEIPNSNGVIETLALQPNHIFDLFYMLHMDTDLYYKGDRLSNDDKEKIKSMLKLLFE